MSSVSAWKIRREVFRLVRKAASLPAVTAELLLVTKVYDLIQSRKVKTSVGQVPLGDKVAIYLVFPESGVQKSHSLALDYLRAKGYAPVVVSNVPLRDAECRDLLGQSALVIQRPNIGYDFGGYRDGIRAIMPVLPRLQQLVILNDSAWFPARPGADWIADAEAMDRDLVAATSNYGFCRADVEAFRDARWSFGTDHPNFHYCSFALLLGSRILRAPDFARFWNHLPLTQNKTRTVRRGEIGFTRWTVRHGFSHGATHDPVDLDLRLEALNDKALREFVRTTVIFGDERLAAVKRDLLAAPRIDRPGMIGFVLTAVARLGAGYVLANDNILNRGCAFLKKSPVWLDRDASDLTVELVESIGGDLGATLLAEVADLRGRKLPGLAQTFRRGTATPMPGVGIRAGTSVRGTRRAVTSARAGKAQIGRFANRR